MQLRNLISVENNPQNNPFLRNKKEKISILRNKKSETNGGSLKIMNKKEFILLCPMPDGAFQTDFRGEKPQ